HFLRQFCNGNRFANCHFMHHRLGRHFETVVFFLRFLLDLQTTRTAIVLILHQLLNMIVARLGHHLGRLVFFPTLVGRLLFFLIPFGPDFLLGLFRLVLFHFFRFSGNLFFCQNRLFSCSSLNRLCTFLCDGLNFCSLCSGCLLRGLNHSLGSNLYGLRRSLFGWGLLHCGLFGLESLLLAFFLLLRLKLNICPLDVGTLLTDLHINGPLTTYLKRGCCLTL